jgi:hypothetical protein
MEDNRANRKKVKNVLVDKHKKLPSLKFITCFELLKQF